MTTVTWHVLVSSHQEVTEQNFENYLYKSQRQSLFMVYNVMIVLL